MLKLMTMTAQELAKQYRTLNEDGKQEFRALVFGDEWEPSHDDEVLILQRAQEVENGKHISLDMLRKKMAVTRKELRASSE
ncbi:MAG: hypothetical protein GY822_06450 [Deltaproteobacteria bacterium]|nr:hypothetical protein [Deltaproteobacteria bacterium]